jgi:hypothetical protein
LLVSQIVTDLGKNCINIFTLFIFKNPKICVVVSSYFVLNLVGINFGSGFWQ